MKPDLELKLRKATEAAFERWEKAGRRVPLKFIAEYRSKGGTMDKKATGKTGKVDQPVQTVELERTEIGSADPKSGPTGPDFGLLSPAEMAISASWITKLAQKTLARESSWSRVKAGLADDAMSGAALHEIRSRVRADAKAMEDSKKPMAARLPESSREDQWTRNRNRDGEAIRRVCKALQRSGFQV
jgi:hypothetical protein